VVRVLNNKEHYRLCSFD